MTIPLLALLYHICCSNMCENGCTQTQMHSLTMCFAGLSPTSFCRKLTLPSSLCYPAHPLCFLLACLLLPRSVTHQHPSHGPSIFSFSSSVASSPPFSLFSLSLHVYFLLLHLLLLFLLPSTGPLCWAAAQCGSETGCNYFTPPLTALVTKERENEKMMKIKIKKT